MKENNKGNYFKKLKSGVKGITLIALVVTIIVLLILAGVAISLTIGNNGIFTRADNSAEKYKEASINEQDEINKAISTIDEISGNLNNKEDQTIAVFDTGVNIAAKMRYLYLEGNVTEQINLSIDAIKKYEGTPDESLLTEDNLVSIDKYLEENPEIYEEYIPEGIKLSPIYMWFEESGETEVRNAFGNDDLSYDPDNPLHQYAFKEVKTGTIYWWCESSDIYLNPNASSMFGGLVYLKDIESLKYFKTDFVTNANSMFYWCAHIKNINSLSDWNTENFTNMGTMFSECPLLEDITGLENWNTSKVTNMERLFTVSDSSSPKFNNLTPLAKWDVSNVENMELMFSGCINLTDASAINDWNISNVTNFNSMFSRVNTHPNFTKREGVWNEDGTFIPNN